MQRTGLASLTLLSATAVYLAAWPAPNLFYAAIVLLHVGLGVVFCLFAARLLPQVLRQQLFLRIASLILAAGALTGLALIATGTTRPFKSLYVAHIALCGAAIAMLAAWKLSQRAAQGTSDSSNAQSLKLGFSRAANGPNNARASAPEVRVSAPKSLWAATLAMFVLAVAVSGAAWFLRQSWSKQYVIRNPSMAPLSMDNEGDGPKGMFFPSSAQVAGKRKIPAMFFMESDACARCHQDIYNQWQHSAHHLSSFNNQWYRKSIEYMQEVKGTQPSKWCGGCHDPAVLYSGLMDTPIKQVVHRPEAQAGLGCMMCHSITQVKSTMGQGDFMLEYPELHELAATKNPVLRWIHDFGIKLNPEPHRRVFLKPFMKDQPAEFCSSCHKVHLDVPVNGYRWIRGFNEYDNWQASGVSGFGARSFYYPPKSQQCADCHMPLTSSKDMGNIQGQVHSHAFPGANTALPTAYEDAKQLDLVEKFLRSGALSVDIFALSRAAATASAASAQSEQNTSFAVGEEAEMKSAGASGAGEAAAPISAPLDRVDAALRRGENVRLDVVVRTRRVGHFFPGGTVDAYDCWLELKGVDDKGKTVFWSGKVEDDGRGPVEKGAHFYRSLAIDEHGNPINKRNAWATRAVVYVRLIPPGAADTVHFRVKVPEDAGNKITFTARLLYRKFAWWNTQFSFAGQSALPPKAPHTAAGFDDRPQTFDASLVGVSAKREAIPNVPIITVAESKRELKVVDKKTSVGAPETAVAKDECQRWNDYGIGLFLQGDLKSAAAAFQKVTEADPQNPDGWINLGRVAVQEGDVDRAREVLTKALKLKPDLARAHFFYARVLRAEGDYDGAARELQSVVAQHPKDRVVRNDLGRVLFLQRKYRDAIAQFNEAIAIDPEDLQANYNLMLCYRGLGDTERAAMHEKLYMRFKADESAQALTGDYRRTHPEDNNERQSVHEHVSVPLGAPQKPAMNRAASVKSASLSGARP